MSITHADLVVGTRVRLTQFIGGRYPGAFCEIPAGKTGVIVSIDLRADREDAEPLCQIKMDEHIEDLNEWDNCLHVWDDQAAECSLACLDLA